MGMQFLLRAPSVEAVTHSLGDLANSCEVFSVSPDLVGVSVPAKTVDGFGEELVLARVRTLPAYELWSGEWHQPPDPPSAKPRWKFW